MKKTILSIMTVLCLSSELVMAQDQYPFDLPNTVTANLTVDEDETEAFKNQLLGYNIEWFSTTVEKDFIRKFNPISIRFPHGVWANFHKWQTDGYQNDSYDNGSHESALVIYEANVKGHINNIAELSAEREESLGQGFHMMWTYSMNFDDAASCVARAQKDADLGLEIKDIELGNEHFWKTQRSNQTATEADFLSRAKSVATALHTNFPDVRVSIPFSWRRSHETYNKTIADDTEYYDAISLHKYMGADPDVPGESNSAYSALLTSRNVLATDVNWIRTHAGNKPIWLTEWAVSANSDAEVNSAAALGMADVYLFMSENQTIYDRASWFIFNKALNPMVLVGSDRRPIYPLQKRVYLSVYEIIHEAFVDAQMLKSSMVSTQLTTNMNVVNARIVEKDGKRTIVAVNLGDKPANFILKFGNQTYVDEFIHKALVFDGLGPVANIGIDDDPKDLIKQGSGTITLPPLSLNEIVLVDDNTNVNVSHTHDQSAYPNPSENGVFYLIHHQKWEVYTFVGQKIRSGVGSCVDLSDFQKGLYILKTNTGSEKLLWK